MPLLSDVTEQMAKMLSEFNELETAEIMASLQDHVRNSPKSRAKTNRTTQTAKTSSTQRKVRSAAPSFSIRKKTSPKRVDGPPIRPLNSWMAFRSYHAQIFKCVQQKSISGYLKQIWAADPYKAKWAVIAKAYALIRDQHSKANAPLDTFLDLVGPMAGAINHTEYLSIMGWYFSEEEGNRVLKRAFIPDTSMIPEHYRTTSVSAGDIVQFCAMQGFIPDTVNEGNTQLFAVSQPNLKDSPGGFDTLETHAWKSNNIMDSPQTPIWNQASSSPNESPIPSFQPDRRIHTLARIVPTSDSFEPSQISPRADPTVNKGHMAYDAFDPLSDKEFPVFSPHLGFDDEVFSLNDPSAYFTPSFFQNTPDFGAESYLNF